MLPAHPVFPLIIDNSFIYLNYFVSEFVSLIFIFIHFRYPLSRFNGMF